MVVNEFTQYVAIFAATLAAVNIFNSHLNNPFILGPLSDRIKYYKACCERVASGLILPTSKNQIDSKIFWLSTLMTIGKGIAFFYNAFVLMSWGGYTWSLLGGTFEKDSAYNFLMQISVASVLAVFTGVSLRVVVYCISKTEKLVKEDAENLLAANEHISHGNCGTRNIT